MLASVKKLTTALEKKKAKFTIIEHRVVYTAYDAAQTLHVPAAMIAKTLVLKSEPGMFLVVVPGDRNLDLAALKKLAKSHFAKENVRAVKSLGFIKEAVIKKNLTKGVGAVAAFGSLYGLPTFVDRALLKQKKIYFPTGAFDSSLLMTAPQYKKIEAIVVGGFSVKRPPIKIAKPVKKSKKVAKKSTKKAKKRR